MNLLKVLLVEDNEGDIILTKESFIDAKILNEIDTVRDGDEAINYLIKTKKEKPEDLPNLILLDINLPKIDGKEVLSFIKQDEILQKITVVMLTTSSSEMDIKDSYNNRADNFILKPVDFIKLFDIIKKVDNFWIAAINKPINNT